MTDIEHVLKRVESIAVGLGFQLAKPARLIERLNCVRLDFIDDSFIEFDSEALSRGAASDALVINELEALRNAVVVPPEGDTPATRG